MTSEQLAEWKKYRERIERMREFERNIDWEHSDSEYVSMLLRIEEPSVRPVDIAVVAGSSKYLVRWSDGHIEQVPMEDLI